MASVTVLDGGISDQLSHYVGNTMDGHPLWCSRFLATNPEAVKQTHLDFLNAGSEVFNTCTYQGSVPGFVKHLGLDEEAAFKLLMESVKIARQAIDEYLKANPKAKRPLIAGSVGPYGAYLNDGSEYTGSYINTVDRETICNWHRPRISALVQAGVDLLAIETIPAKAEAEVLVELIKEFPGQKAWLSFQCKDSEHLANGDLFHEAVQRCWELNSGQLVALGCNCVHPKNVSGLLKSVNENSKEKIPFVVYSNSGESYSEEKGWYGREHCINLGEYVPEWLNLGVIYVGSCCRTTASDVADIRKAVDHWLSQKK